MKYKLEYEASCPGLGKNKGEVEFEASDDAAAEKEITNILFHQYNSSQWRDMGSTPSDWKPLRLSRIEHLKSYTTNVLPSVDYGRCGDEETFKAWVTVNHGTDVRDACMKILKSELEKGVSVNAEQVLNRINFATDMIDLSKNPMRARFV